MRILRVAAVLLFASPLFAQMSRNAAYAEIGGNGIVPTVNYERRVGERVLARVGFSYVTSEDDLGDRDEILVFPLTLAWLSHPASNHHAELGGGVTFVTGETSAWATSLDEEVSGGFGTATIGYRYQKPGRGFVFRSGLTPIFDEDGVTPWLGVSFGYAW